MTKFDLPFWLSIFPWTKSIIIFFLKVEAFHVGSMSSWGVQFNVDADFLSFIFLANEIELVCRLIKMQGYEIRVLKMWPRKVFETNHGVPN